MGKSIETILKNLDMPKIFQPYSDINKSIKESLSNPIVESLKIFADNYIPTFNPYKNNSQP